MTKKNLLHYTIAQRAALSVATLRLRLLRSCGNGVHAYQLAQCLSDCAVRNVPMQDVVTMIDTVFADDDARVPTVTVGAAWQLAQDIATAT